MNTNASNEPPRPAIPDHEVLRCIGHGSFGVVWLARNMMGTFRAVKVVSRRSFENPRPYERELAGIRRFEPVSRLHEGFVDILHVGSNEAEEYFYYIMELGDDQIQGQTIDPDSYSPKTLAREISLRGKLFLEECVQLGLSLSAALGELHDLGLVHRDIKPANIIFVNGVPKLADAGLVADIKAPLTNTGTKGYIPPEGPGTAQADIYGFGKVLYEAATGKDREEFPELPALPTDPLESRRFLDLNEIILEACQNDPKKRYRSAWDIHSDLQMIPDNVSVREVKVLRRRLARLKRVALISALALLGVGSVGYQIYREVRSRIEARDREVNANVLKGNRALEAGDLGGSVPYFVNALKLEEGMPDRKISDRLRLGAVLAEFPKLTQCWSPAKEIHDGEFSPDGNKVVIAGFSDPTQIFDLASGKLYAPAFGAPRGVLSAEFSFDNRFLVTSCQDGSNITWDAVSLARRDGWGEQTPLFNARFNRAGTRIVVAGKDGFARVLDANTGDRQLMLRHAGPVRFADFSHDGLFIVTASEDGTAQIWDAGTGQPFGASLRHGGWVYYAAFSPDDKLVVTASSDRTAKVWEVEGSRQIRPDLAHRQGVRSAEFSPDGRWILTASLDGTARLWSANDLKPLEGNSVLDHGAPLSRATFSPDGHLILTTSLSGSARVWDLAGSGLFPIPTQAVFNQQGTRSLLIIANENIEVRDAVSDVLISICTNAGPPLAKAEFSRNGHWILGTSRFETNAQGMHLSLQVWDAERGKAIGPALPFSKEQFRGAALSEDGQRVVVFHDRLAQVWDALSGTNLTAPLPHSAPVTLAMFSPVGNRLAIACGNDVILRNAISGQAIGDPMAHPVRAGHVEFSPDGAWLATCCRDPLITPRFCQIWNATTGRAASGRLWHTDGVFFAAFSPNSRRVVTTGEDYAAMIWDFAAGTQVGSTLNHTKDVEMAVFSPNGKWIVTASADCTARVWDAETGYPLTLPLRHFAPVISARFLADGRRIVTIDDHGHSWIWKLPVDNRSIEDLSLVGRLVSGGIENFPRVATQPLESLETIWGRLVSKHRSDFTTIPAEIASWHDSQAEESEENRQWSAAIFHLKWLLTRKPGDQDLILRLSRAEEQLRASQQDSFENSNHKSVPK